MVIMREKNTNTYTCTCSVPFNETFAMLLHLIEVLKSNQIGYVEEILINAV